MIPIWHKIFILYWETNSGEDEYGEGVEGEYGEEVVEGEEGGEEQPIEGEDIAGKSFTFTSVYCG